ALLKELAPVAATLPALSVGSGSGPSELPGYEILGEVGRGATGVVYKAVQRSLNRVMALKVLRDGWAGSGDELLRFRREAEWTASLSHPNIVQVYEVGEYDGHAYLAMEFVDGCSLAQQLGSQPQPPAQAAALVETLARAVHHAHQGGIIHRD